MSMQVTCPECDSDFPVADHLEGEKVACRGCGASFRATPKKDGHDIPLSRGRDASRDARSQVTTRAPVGRPSSPAPRGDGRRSTERRSDEGRSSDSRRSRSGAERESSSMLPLVLGLIGVGLVGAIVAIILLLRSRGAGKDDTVAEAPPAARAPEAKRTEGKIPDPDLKKPVIEEKKVVEVALVKGFQPLDVAPHINWKRGEAIQVAGNDLGNIPSGRQTLADVPFEVRDGAILLSGKLFARDRPAAVAGIPVGTRFKRLHALHTAHYSTPRGKIIGDYLLTYQDGTSAELPIIYDQHVHNWWLPFAPGADTRIGWAGSNGASGTIFYYATRYDNPHPGKAVASIGMVSRNTTASPCIVALTIEE